MYTSSVRMAGGQIRLLGPLKGLFSAPYFEFMRNLRMAHPLPNSCTPGKVLEFNFEQRGKTLYFVYIEWSKCCSVLLAWCCLTADQTCDQNTSCVFSKHQALFVDIDVCQDVFGISRAEIYERVAFTNAYYGGRAPKGTRIVFVNGETCSHVINMLKRNLKIILLIA